MGVLREKKKVKIKKHVHSLTSLSTGHFLLNSGYFSDKQLRKNHPCKNQLLEKFIRWIR